MIKLPPRQCRSAEIAALPAALDLDKKTTDQIDKHNQASAKLEADRAELAVKARAACEDVEKITHAELEAASNAFREAGLTIEQARLALWRQRGEILQDMLAAIGALEEAASKSLALATASTELRATPRRLRRGERRQLRQKPGCGRAALRCQSPRIFQRPRGAGAFSACARREQDLRGLAPAKRRPARRPTKPHARRTDRTCPKSRLVGWTGRGGSWWAPRRSARADPIAAPAPACSLAGDRRPALAVLTLANEPQAATGKPIASIGPRTFRYYFPAGPPLLTRRVEKLVRVCLFASQIAEDRASNVNH